MASRLDGERGSQPRGINDTTRMACWILAYGVDFDYSEMWDPFILASSMDAALSIFRRGWSSPDRWSPD